MPYRILNVLLVIWLAMGLAALSTWGQEQPAAPKPEGPKKEWKDGQAEYNMFVAVTKESDNHKKLTLLNAWKEKYANTDFKLERLQLYLTTYQALGQPPKMIETAKEMLAIDPKNVQALYWISFLAPQVNDTSAEALDSAEKTANGLLVAEKPAGTSEPEWEKAKKEMGPLAYKTIGWVENARKNPEAAEKAFVKSLQLKPEQGDVSYSLGTVIVAQKKPERYSEALYHFARAATLDQSKGGLPPQGRQQIDKYFVQNYTKYHGQDEAGLKGLRAMAVANPFPPPDFKIKSSTELAVEKENELQKSNPQLALWKNVRGELTGPNGEQYFQSSMKGSLFPKAKGKLISQSPAVRPKELKLAIENPTTADATLVLDAPLAGKAEPGTEITFEGVPESYTKEPFNVTFNVEKAKIGGWPAPATPKKAGTKKSARKR